MTEVAPGWRNDGPQVWYADNSIEQSQVCANGCHRRNLMIAGPGGDASF
jgi:hypothetical protein